MDKRLWVNLSKTVVMSMIGGAFFSSLGSPILYGDFHGFWPLMGVMTPFSYWLFYKKGHSWKESIKHGAHEFNLLRDFLRGFNDHNKGQYAGA